MNDGPHGKQSDADSRVKDPLVLGAAALNVLDYIAGQPQGIGGIQYLALGGLLRTMVNKSKRVQVSKERCLQSITLDNAKAIVVG